MVHMDLIDLRISQIWEINFRCWRRLWFLEQVPVGGHIKVIIGPNFTKRAWMVQRMIIIQQTGFNAESEPYVLIAVGG